MNHSKITPAIVSETTVPASQKREPVPSDYQHDGYGSAYDTLTIAGHHVTPLRIPTDPNFDKDAGGCKVPLLKDYLSIHSAKKSALLRKRFGDTDRGAGVLVVGDLFFVDSDVKNSIVAEIIRQAFEEVFHIQPSRVGGNPKRLWPMRIDASVSHSLTKSIKFKTRPDESDPKEQYEQVEFFRVKLDGTASRQIVMSGEHSDEHGQYKWYDGGPERPISEYHVVTEASFIRFRDLVIERSNAAGFECSMERPDFRNRTKANPDLFRDFEGNPIVTPDDSEAEDFMERRSPFEGYPVGKLRELQAHDDWKRFHYDELSLRVFEVCSCGRGEEYRQYCFDKAFSANGEGRHQDSEFLWTRINGLFDRSEEYTGKRRGLPSIFKRYRDHIADVRELESLTIRDDLITRIRDAKSESDLIPLKRECRELELSEAHRQTITGEVEDWYEAHKGKTPSSESIALDWHPAPKPKDKNLMRRDIILERASVYSDEFGNTRLRKGDGNDYLVGADDYMVYCRQTIDKVLGVHLKKSEGLELSEALFAVVPEKKIPVFNRYALIRTPNDQTGEVAEHVYIDTGWPCRSVIHVRAGDWEVIQASACPVRFTRIKDFNGALPNVSKKTTRLSWDTFCASHMPTIPKHDRIIVQAWGLDSMRSGRDFAILTLLGGHGVGKTYAARALIAVLDPTIGDISSDGLGEDFDRLSSRVHLYAHDDLEGKLKPGEQKLVGRRATGSKRTRRLMYAERMVTRPITGPQIMTANEPPLTTTDGKSRQLLINCVRIELPKGVKAPDDAELSEALDADLPSVFAGILDELAGVLQPAPTVSVRTSDVRFKRLLRIGATLHENWLGDPDDFATALEAKIVEERQSALDELPAVRALVDIAKNRKGLPPVLLSAEELKSLAWKYHEFHHGHIHNRSGNGWPLTARAMTKQLKESNQTMLDEGVRIVRHTVNPKKRRWVLQPIKGAKGKPVEYAHSGLKGKYRMGVSGELANSGDWIELDESGSESDRPSLH